MQKSSRIIQQSLISSFLFFSPILSHAIEPAAIDIGELKLYPTLNLASGYDDNILKTQTSEKSSLISRINPNFLLEAETDNALFRFNYGLEQGIYHSSSEDNYLDHNLNASAFIVGNSRNRVDLKTSVIKGHEARGDEDGGSISVTDSPLKFDLYAIQGIYTYGGRRAKGQLEFSAGYEDMKYTNFRSVSFARDNDQTDVSFAFKYRVSDRTSAFTKAIRTDIDYDHSNKDSTNYRYLFGATWDATAKTSGTFDIGWAEKDFDDSALDDAHGGTWDADINWNPKSYSTFVLNSGQEFGESTTTDSHIDSKHYGISWYHYWKSNTKSTVSYRTEVDDFSSSTRKDTTNTMTLGLNFEKSRWLDIGVKYTLIDKKSNFSNSSYKNNTLFLTAESSL